MLSEPEYSGEAVADLLMEPKFLPESGLIPSLKVSGGSAHREWKSEVISGKAGNRFRVVLRQTVQDRDDFSVVLLHLPAERSGEFTLTRYNGNHGQHSNPLEGGQKFTGMHIHRATERYQLRKGAKAEHYAEPTDRYSDLRGALDCMMEDCAFVLPPAAQAQLRFLGEDDYDGNGS